MSAVPQPLFRDGPNGLINTIVLLWTGLGWLGSFALMASPHALAAGAGVLLSAHAMILAAYLVHEAAHYTLFRSRPANWRVGEAMSFVAGSSCASFARIRHMHLRHHRDRADLACFDYKALLRRWPMLRRALEALEWAYVPATELLMHWQVVLRPVLERGQRRHLPRALTMLAVRAALLAVLGFWSIQALLLYGLATLLFLQVLSFFDSYHHSFEQYFVEADQPVPTDGRDRTYEQVHTYSNLVSLRHPWLNLLILNFGYHNAHHARAGVPWHRLPALHRQLYGAEAPAVMPLRQLLAGWHRNRVRRVAAEDYGAPGIDFVGAHGVSFLTVV
jgi:fatty acid desaturase